MSVNQKQTNRDAIHRRKVNQLGLGEISDDQFGCRLTERGGYHLQLINTSVEKS